MVNDALAFFKSMSLTMPSSRVYAFVDDIVFNSVGVVCRHLPLDVRWIIRLNDYTGMTREAMEKAGIFGKFLSAKTDALMWAFNQGESSVMYLDCDIFFLEPIRLTGYSDQKLILSPHMIKKNDEQLYGRFNGGVFGATSAKVVESWIKHSSRSRFFDQACLEDVATEFEPHLMHAGQNMAWWRIFQGEQKPAELVSQFTWKDGRVFYQKNQVEFIHTHLGYTTGFIGSFNQLMKIVLSKAAHPLLNMYLEFCRSPKGNPALLV
jgi:hypothetical protein